MDDLGLAVRLANVAPHRRQPVVPVPVQQHVREGDSDYGGYLTSRGVQFAESGQRDGPNGYEASTYDENTNARQVCRALSVTC